MCTATNTISLFAESVAYETILAGDNVTLKLASEMFKNSNYPPTKILEFKKDLFSENTFNLIKEYISHIHKQCNFSACIKGDFQYPGRMLDAKHPLELFYYRGDIGLLDSKCVSVVGSRKASNEGIARAKKLAIGLVKNNYTIVSGLATGIDTAAMTAAINSNGRTIGVIGTPINDVYPKENADLQETIANRFLLISQVPFYRYKNEPFKTKRYYFPQRNETMSAISIATIIVEASDTSGTLTQARACLEQGRKLLILKSIVDNSKLTWPKYYLERGAHQVSDFNDVLNIIER